MCGFAGFLGYKELRNHAAQAVAQQMGEAIRHRGPDDSAVWCDELVQLALVHRRLAIVDLSAAGRQPMQSASGRYVIAFNGEIYNHLVLRRELGAGLAQSNQQSRSTWRGHSDTETLLAALEAWGLRATLQRLLGMFAFALWDRQTRTLYLARDRMGEKPLYYGWQRGVFLFGSELKALKAHPAFSGSIDRASLALQLRHNYIPAPYSIYCDIRKLVPGQFLELNADSRLAGEEKLHTYWSFTEVAASGQANLYNGSETEAVNALEVLLRESVAQQMVADVPLGAFLSGGVDSSTIVALMQAQSARPVKTFTIGFHEESYNEAEHAKAVARYLGTEHTELYVSAAQAMAVIPRLPSLYDEPFSDSSQIPTFLVSAMTSEHVTVALSGDAGDELFGGYSRYVMTANLWHKLGKIPLSIRHLLANGIQNFSPATWNRCFNLFRFLLPDRLRPTNFGDKLHKGAAVLTTANLDTLYAKLVSHWEPHELGLNSAHQTLYSIMPSGLSGLDPIQQMMLKDSLSYLPDDILCKVDRAAMGVSLETRVPFLDHRVIEFAWSLPLAMKIRHGQGKWILRQVLYKYVPQELIERPKMGFGVPLDSWLRGPLRDWAEVLLSETRLRQEGFFNPLPIRQKWAEHLSGQRNWQYHLWDVLMFQAWLAHQTTANAS